jgi:citrate lyase beta subunit
MTDLSIRSCRSSLFWSALRLKDLDLLKQLDTDIICIDLEDAVPPSYKSEARVFLREFLINHTPISDTRYIVRTNASDTEDGNLDLEMLLKESGFISHLVIPKLESIEELKRLDSKLNQNKSSLNLIGIIETPKGLEFASTLAMIESRLQGFYFGGFDLSNSLGCEMEWNSLLYARSRVVHAAALGNLIAIDSPPPFVDETIDQNELSAYCLRSKALGMIGMVTKHVSQINTIRTVFSSTEVEIERAKKILNLYANNPSQPIIFEGKLIELPMIKKLQKLV